jgi:hypothetical protein
VGTGCGANANGGGSVAAGNKANCVGGVRNVVGVGADDTTSSGVGAVRTSFVPKTNSSIVLPSGLRFLVLMSTLS